MPDTETAASAKVSQRPRITEEIKVFKVPEAELKAKGTPSLASQVSVKSSSNFTSNRTFIWKTSLVPGDDLAKLPQGTPRLGLHGQHQKVKRDLDRNTFFNT